MKSHFRRSLVLPPAGAETFFLWGPRQTGKSTLLRASYPGARWIDLLKADHFRLYAARPERLRQELEAGIAGNAAGTGSRGQIVVDEIQKVPALLDEVHWLMERRGHCFALCGSSARKVRRGGANLLGGRALRYELRGVTAREMADDFDLDRVLNHGYLPRVYQASRPGRLLDAYVGDYLKEEVAAEGLVRNIPRFAGFLEAAALCDGEVVNVAAVARECGVSGHTARGHFEILEDTLLGTWLPAYRKRAKRRVVRAPKFYFSDVGVVNRLARRGRVLPGSADYGRAFENWVFHELAACSTYREDGAPLSYWRLAGGTEVDFVLGDMEVAVEAKSGRSVTSATISRDCAAWFRTIRRSGGESSCAGNPAAGAPRTASTSSPRASSRPDFGTGSGPAEGPRPGALATLHSFRPALDEWLHVSDAMLRRRTVPDADLGVVRITTMPVGQQDSPSQHSNKREK